MGGSRQPSVTVDGETIEFVLPRKVNVADHQPAIELASAVPGRGFRANHVEGVTTVQEENISPLQHNMRRLVDLSMREGYCDITFRNRAPLIGVRLKPTLNAALMYGAGAQKMAQLFDQIETRDGTVFRAVDVWVIVEFPKGLPSDTDLACVDLADGDAEVAPGVSMRQMAKEVYHCADDEIAEKMLRRILAA